MNSKSVREGFYWSIGAIIKSKYPDYVREWAAWHQMLGCRHFYLVDDGCSPSLAETLGDLHIKVTYVPLDDFGRAPGEDRQRHAYRTILAQDGGRSTWVALLDDDEFLVPTNPKQSVGHVLGGLEHAPCVELQWRVFGPEGRERPPAEINTPCQYSWYKPMKTCKTVVRTGSGITELANPHRALIKGAVDCHGDSTSPFSAGWGSSDVMHRQHVADPTLVIHHYCLRTLELANDKLTERNFLPNQSMAYRLSRVTRIMNWFTDPGAVLDGRLQRFSLADHPHLCLPWEETRKSTCAGMVGR